MLSGATETLSQEALEGPFDEAICWRRFGRFEATGSHVVTDGERRKRSFATSRGAALWPPPAE